MFTIAVCVAFGKYLVTMVYRKKIDAPAVTGPLLGDLLTSLEGAPLWLLSCVCAWCLRTGGGVYRENTVAVGPGCPFCPGISDMGDVDSLRRNDVVLRV